MLAVRFSVFQEESPIIQEKEKNVPEAPAMSSLTLSNRLDELERLSAWLEEQGAALSLPPPLIMDLNLVLEEWVVNVISYAFDDEKEHLIDLRLGRSADKLIIEIEDGGKPFDPTSKADVDTSLPLEQRSIGGLGIHFIRSRMDDFTYRREGNRNLVTLVKVIAPERS